jgi:hypothetical protein
MYATKLKDFAISTESIFFLKNRRINNQTYLPLHYCYEGAFISLPSLIQSNQTSNKKSSKRCKFHVESPLASCAPVFLVYTEYDWDFRILEAKVELDSYSHWKRFGPVRLGWLADLLWEKNTVLAKKNKLKKMDYKADEQDLDVGSSWIWARWQGYPLGPIRYRSSRYSAAAPPDTAEERRRVQDVAAAAGLGEHGVAIAPGGIARKVGRWARVPV